MFERKPDFRQTKIFKSATQGGLSSLKNLDLNENQIAVLAPGYFSSLAALEILDLTGNKLEELQDGCFDGLSSLKELNLDQAAREAARELAASKGWRL